MTPISSIASLPPAGAGFDPDAGRAARQASPPAEPVADTPERSFWDRIWGKEGFSFGALLDIVNPLQHLPVVGTIYRAATGDTIGPGPRMMGGAIFGGVVGLITSAADVAVEYTTGKDTGSHVLAMLPEKSEPVSQWAADDEPRHRGLMTAVLNLPDASPTQFAAAPEAGEPASASKETTTAAAVISPAPPQATAVQAAATPAATRMSEPSAHPLASQPRVAQLGAGGRLVPLASNGRPGTQLPTPKELAANPALLQELRQGGASAVNASEKNTGRIDTAIKGRGLVAPATMMDPAKGPSAGGSAQSDTTRDSQPITFDARKHEQARGTATQNQPSPIPEVGGDFLMKMQQALDKYQAIRAAPTVDVSH